MDPELAIKDFLKWSNDISALMLIASSDWDRLERAVSSLEKKNPRFKEQDHVLAIALPFFWDLLRQRKLRHPKERYSSLLELLLRNFPQPLMIFTVIATICQNFEDPADIMERTSVLPLDAAWRAEQPEEALPTYPYWAVRVDQASAYDSQALARARTFYADISSIFREHDEEIQSFLSLDCSNWDAVIEAMCALERKEPRFKERHRVVAIVAPTFCTALSQRKGLRHEVEYYGTLLDHLSWHFPQPLLLAYVAQNLLNRAEDPAFLLERAERSPFTPSWLLEATSQLQ